MESKQTGQQAKVERRLTQLANDLATCHLPISTRLKNEIERYIRANEEQHTITRRQIKSDLNEAMHGLGVLQGQVIGRQKGESQFQQRRERLIESLRFEEINSRSNNVSTSHPETFQWIFDESRDHPWNGFRKWLNSDENIYWINGKPVSGKSTLMKFLAKDPRTRRLLKRTANQDVLIVTFYLWLSGSKMQRSLKGLLCSIALQILLYDEALLQFTVDYHAELHYKRNNDDWSVDDLSQLLRTLTGQLTCPICIFIDGVDEFD